MKSFIKASPSGKHQRGFTLIELMIVVAIVTIIAAVGYPNYIQYTVRSNRSAAESHMLSVANKQEQYMLDARQYFSVSTATGCTNVLTASSADVTPPAEVSKHYSIDICASTGTPPTYLITAEPTGGQLTNDTQCGTLTFNQAGSKTKSSLTGTVAACW